MALTAYQQETAERVESDVIDFLPDLVEVDPNLSSEVRREYYDLLSELLTDLSQAINKGDVDEVEKRIEAVDEVRDLIEWNNEAALEEFKQIYGNFIEDVLNIQNRHISNLVFIAIKSVWHDFQRRRVSTKRNFTVPTEVFGFYQVEVVNTIDAFFSYHASRFYSKKQLGVLTIQDIIHPLQLLKPMKAAAQRSILLYRLSKTLVEEEEEDESNIVEDLWSVFGVESFSELAFDVAIFVGTGGLSGVVKAGRIVVKGAKVLRKAHKHSKRLNKTLKVTRETISRAKQQQKALRARLKKYSKKNKKIQRKKAQTGLRQESARIRNLYNDAIEIIRYMKDSKAAIKEISKAIKPIQDVMRGVITNKASYSILGKDYESYTDDARKEAGKTAMKAFLKRRRFFGDDIKKLQKSAILALASIDKRRKKRLFVKWWIRLFIRQIVVYALIEILRQKSLSPKTFHVILNKSFVAASEEVLEPFLPNSMVVKLILNIDRKVVTGITDKFGDIIYNQLVKIYKAL